jgi:hypothetical protein
MQVLDLPANAHISATGIADLKTEKDINIPVAGEQPLPREIQFGGLLGPGLRFRKPLQVKLYRDGETCVAQCLEIDQFGYASSFADALDDLGRTLSEMYSYLADAGSSDGLSEALKGQYAQLGEFIELRPPTK